MSGSFLCKIPWENNPCMSGGRIGIREVSRYRRYWRVSGTIATLEKNTNTTAASTNNSAKTAAKALCQWSRCSFAVTHPLANGQLISCDIGAVSDTPKSATRMNAVTKK